MFKHLLTVSDIDRGDLNRIFQLAGKLKRERGKEDFRPLAGKNIGMIFAKSSTRTRVSFEVGINELGGHSLYLDQNKMQVERGETVADTARVLSRYLHGIVIRTYEQANVEELAAHGSIPVINALTNEFHPCQILTDLFTIYEYSGTLDGVKLVFAGDGQSNMANSLIMATRLADLELVITSPETFKPSKEMLAGGDKVRWEPNSLKAVEDADYIYTDVWVSMGFEEQAAERLAQLTPYQVNTALLEAASPKTRVMHCLPAHRGEEITNEVMDSPQAIVFDQAENRLHVQKAILALLFAQESS